MAVRTGLVLVLVLAVLAGSADARPTAVARVARVIDGDTIVLTDGAHVRLLQIDTPEPGTSECYSRAAGRDLRRMLPVGSVVTLETDPALDQVDRYGRLLRYVHRAGRTSRSCATARRRSGSSTAIADSTQARCSPRPSRRASHGGGCGARARSRSGTRSAPQEPAGAEGGQARAASASSSSTHAAHSGDMPRSASCPSSSPR